MTVLRTLTQSDRTTRQKGRTLFVNYIRSGRAAPQDYPDVVGGAIFTPDMPVPPVITNVASSVSGVEITFNPSEGATRYVVTFWAPTRQTVTGTASPILLAGLTLATLYGFELVAVNDQGLQSSAVVRQVTSWPGWATRT